MKVIAGLGAALALVVLAAPGAKAQFTPFATEGDWEIAVNSNMGPGCVAISKFRNPTSQVQMGIDATNPEHTGYLAIYVEGADGIAAGEEIPASFELGEDVFEGTFIGQQTDGFGGAFVPVNNPDFIYDLSEKEEMIINYGEGRRVIVGLDNTDAVFDVLRTCQETQ
ncbi:MAG: hypothetical protein AAGG56_14160 [Pseudomonadota bacterium]